MVFILPPVMQTILQFGIAFSAIAAEATISSLAIKFAESVGLLLM